MKTLLITGLAVAGVLGTAATAMAVNSDTVVSPDPVKIVSTDVPTPGFLTDPLVTPDPLETPVPVATPDTTAPSAIYLDDDSDDSDFDDSDFDDSDSDDSDSDDDSPASSS